MKALLETWQYRFGDTAAGRSLSLGWAGAFFVLALAARWWRIETQSVWLDEFFSYNYLNAPSLYGCIARQRPENWEMVPFYYAVQYYWAQWFPGSIVWVRLLSVLPSAAGVAAASLLAWRRLGSVAGWVTGFWLAMSPLQVFYGQGIRPYAWLPLMGVLSWTALCRWQQRDGRRWLAASLLLNALMAWIHLLTPLMFAAQGLWLWGVRRFRVDRALIGWGTLQGLILLTLIPWVMTIRAAPDPPGIAPPPPGSLLGILLDNGMDATESFWGRFLFQENEPVRWAVGMPPKFALDEAGGWPGLMSAARQPLELALARLMLLGMALSLAAAWVRRRSVISADDATAEASDTLTCWLAAALVPVVLLYLAALLWKPHIFQVRYLLFSAVFLPGALSGGVSRIAPRAAGLYGLTAVMLIAALCAGYHAVPVRQNYLGVARMLHDPACQELPVITPDWNSARVLQCNDQTLAPRLIRPVPEQFRATVDAALDAQKPFVILYEGNLSEVLRREVEHELIQREALFRRIIFSGLQNLYVYHVMPRERQPAKEGGTGHES